MIFPNQHEITNSIDASEKPTLEKPILTVPAPPYNPAFKGQIGQTYRRSSRRNPSTLDATQQLESLEGIITPQTPNLTLNFHKSNSQSVSHSRSFLSE